MSGEQIIFDPIQQREAGRTISSGERTLEDVFLEATTDDAYEADSSAAPRE